MTSTDITTALTEHFRPKHVVFAQVKNGPSWGARFRTADFVAIRKTWSPTTIVACEIKVSRSDFTRDHKWTEYLPLCNQFFWACPKGLIKKDEIDARCGLIHVSEKGVAHTAKAALYRDAPPDPLMMLYLLFWRMDEKDKVADMREKIKREIEENAAVGENYRMFVARKLNEADEKIHQLQNSVDERTRAAKLLIEWMVKNHVDDWRLVSLLEKALLLNNINASEFKHQFIAMSKQVVAIAAALADKAETANA